MRRYRAAAFAVMLAFAGTPVALAHAFLDRAAPAVGSEVRSSPPSVTLWFSEELEPAFSSIKVLDAKGQQVDRGDTAPDARDRTSLKVSLMTLPPGTYRVVWRALSMDTHATQGDFSFTVSR